MRYRERLRAAPDDRPKAATRVARSSACTVWCARRVLDTADIVREAIFHDSITVGGSPNFYLPTTKGFVSGAGAGRASLKKSFFPADGSKSYLRLLVVTGRVLDPAKVMAAAGASKPDAIIMGVRGSGKWERAATHIP